MKKKVYMFKWKGRLGDWHESKIYVREYQCYKGAKDLNFRKDLEIKFFEAEVDWQEVENVYNKNTISGGK